MVNRPINGSNRTLARDPEFRVMLRRKHERRLDDESVKPLASYRAEEPERMWVNFFGSDPAYHEARRYLTYGNDLLKALDKLT